MITDVIKILEEAAGVQERTAERLAALVIPINDEYFDMGDKSSCVHLRRLYHDKNSQVLLVVLRPMCKCGKHAHVASTQTFVVTSGTIICNNVIYKAGDTFIIPVNDPHLVCGGIEGGECIVILVPPEEAYK